MARTILILPLVALLVPLSVAAQDVPVAAPVVTGQSLWAQLSIRERVIIRIPREGPPQATITRDAPPPLPQLAWSEGRAPRCVALGSLKGARLTRQGDVDLVTSAGERVRAKLGDDCPALDFYANFYIKPTADGMVCAGRDAIRSRSGAICPISRFRSLIPKR